MHKCGCCWTKSLLFDEELNFTTEVTQRFHLAALDVTRPVHVIARPWDPHPLSTPPEPSLPK
jgi:hypothetical protein